MSLKARIQEDVKNAMRAQQREQLAVLRLVTAAIKQKEVDERIDLDDTQVLAVLDKMVKQRRESLEQYQGAGRDDLAAQEKFELDLIPSRSTCLRAATRSPRCAARNIIRSPVPSPSPTSL